MAWREFSLSSSRFFFRYDPVTFTCMKENDAVKLWENSNDFKCRRTCVTQASVTPEKFRAVRKLVQRRCWSSYSRKLRKNVRLVFLSYHCRSISFSGALFWNLAHQHQSSHCSPEDFFFHFSFFVVFVMWTLFCRDIFSYGSILKVKSINILLLLLLMPEVRRSCCLCCQSCDAVQMMWS